MRISELFIENYRGIKTLSITFDDFSVVLGSNNCGKSTILRAIEAFFNPAPKLTQKDFHNNDPDLTINITVKFDSITAAERVVFGSAVIDGCMQVSREFSIGEPSPNYAVFSMVNPAFDIFRSETNGTVKRSIYAGLREAFDLPQCRAVDDMEHQLRTWEERNPQLLSRQRVRSFFGATNVAAGKLSNKTAVHFIPAVREVSTDAEGAKSPVISLLSDINRQAFENQKELQELVASFNEKLIDMTDPSKIGSLARISESLTEKLKGLYLDSELVASIESANRVEISFPSPSIKVVRDELTLDVAQVGHGLQRAILFSIIQFLAERNQTVENLESQSEFEEAQSDIIILIEEPELYQHPLKQRIIHDWFKDITESFNKATGIRVQVIVVSHSEKFVEMQEISRVRLLRSYVDADRKRCHHVGCLPLAEFSKRMASHAVGNPDPMTDEAFKIGLHIFELRITEGLFADKIILVEGVSDKAVIEGCARQLGVSLIGKGVAVISVNGKDKMPRPLFAFKHFGIETFAIYDNDRGSSPKEHDKHIKINRQLQSICGVENIQDWPCDIQEGFAAFDGNLEKYLRSICKDNYDDIRDQVGASFGIIPKNIEKTPAAVSAFLSIAKGKGYTFQVLEDIVARITS